MVIKTHRVRTDNLVNESERIINNYFDRGTIKKIIGEDNVDEQLSIVEDFLKSSGLESLWKFFEAYRQQFIDFVGVMRGLYPDVEEEVLTKKLGLKHIRPKRIKRKKPEIKKVRFKRYSKSEVMFIRSRIGLSGRAVNKKLQVEHQEFFGFQRTIGSLAYAKHKIKKGKM